MTASIDISPEAVERMAASVATGNMVQLPLLDTAGMLRALRLQLTASEKRELELEQRLLEIGNKAHARSSGPTIRDDWWEVRGMAYELLRKLG